jgi:membrane-associated PAP2 superfamily phosphatase
LSAHPASRADAATAASRRDAWVTLAALLALVLWDASGADLALTRWAGTAAGFPWRDSLLASRVLHDGGRALGWALLALLAWDAARPFALPPPAGPSRAQRARTLAVVLAALVLVPLLKRYSSTSCPWDLAEFGGQAAYVPHWLVGVFDGGPGHCFPSGHAVAAFAYFGVYFLWRHHRPRTARAALVAVLALGLLFGWAQWLRGAHFVSHTLWSAWLCWALAATAAWAWPALPRPAAPAAGVAAAPAL